MKAVITDNLSKTYDSGKKAVDRVCIDLEQGEVFGFLGPNGAGKTTAVKLLSGILSPTEGTSQVFGIDPSVTPEHVHKLAGVVTEHAQMYNSMTGHENLIFYGTLFGMSKADSSDRSLDLLERLDLMEAKDRKLGAYSTGMRQRLSLARAMMHRPRILFLDEPTSGLDPESVFSVNNMIKDLAQNDGTTIFLCTHQLRYAQEICCLYGLINDGSLLASGTLDELRCLVFPGMTVNIETDRFPDAIESSKTGARHYEFKVDSEDEIPLIVKKIVDDGGSVYHVSAKRLSLEEIYFSLIEKKVAKGGGVK